MSSQIPQRTEIAKTDKWKLEDIFLDDKTWEKHFSNLKTGLPELAAFQGRLT